MGRLDGKVAIVTGAGGGIGLEYARRFLSEGARVAVAEVDEGRCRSACEELAQLGDVEPVPTDIADEASVEACVDATRARFDGLDVLVNNAAIYGTLDTSDNSLGYLRTVFDVNLHGQWLMARAVAPHLVAQRSGRIVNIASIAAYLHQINAFDPEFHGVMSYAYAQSKWGVIGLTRHLAGQLGQFNVTVNCIAPGLTMTEATKAVVPDFAHPFFEQLSPMRRNVEADQLTGVALFFASDDAALVNGQILCVDGGTVMPV
jgi:NAD(P)-dependent dehydrogenase (short-subunit alcohol dehydrogenase family)